MKREKLKVDGGYTFVELLVVSTIILILASAIMPLARVTATRQRESELRRTLREIRTAIDKYKDAADAGQIGSLEIQVGSEGYPPDLETLVEGVVAANDATGRKLKFLRHVPVDPMTHTMDWGMRSYQDDPDATKWGGQNVFDIHTTSTGTALDGTKYKKLVNWVIGKLSAWVMDDTRLQRRSRRVCNYPIHRSPGFTLIELLVVLSLILILSTIGLAQYRNSITHANEAVLKTDLTMLREAIDQYYADKGQYPGALDALVTEGYVRAIPVDPFTKSSDSWQTIPSEPDPNNPTAQTGVYNVKSGSDRTALDATKYGDW